MRRLFALLAAALVPLILFSTFGRTQSAEDAAGDEARIRCATRLSLALTGQSPSAELLAAADPQAEVDALLASDAFVESFARFVNSKLNDDPGMTPAEDATYFLARHILTQNRPWHELFDGPYRVRAVQVDGKASAEVVDDANGLGYFRSRPWMVRYAGNEEDGYRLSSAYRIMQNIIGLDISAVQNAPDVDISAEGRMAPACRGCHYDPYFALDKVAKILSRRQGEGADMTFVPPDEGPQEILNGQMISNDEELVAALVESVDFRYRSCRLAFQYVYGRNENTCEAPLFDECMDAFTESGEIRAAIRTLVTDPAFCE